MKKKFWLLFLVFATFPLFPIPASAIKINPAFQLIHVKDGETFKLEVNLAGSTGDPQEYLPKMKQYQNIDGKDILKAQPSDFPIKFSYPAVVTLDKNGLVKFTLEIKTPSGIAAGSYNPYLELEPRFKKLNRFQGTRAEIPGKPGVNIFIRVNDDPKNLIKGASIDPNTINFSLAKNGSRFSAKIRNRGNFILIATDPLLTLTAGKFNETVNLGFFTQRSDSKKMIYVFPGETQILEGVIKAPLYPGEYMAEISYVAQYSKKDAETISCKHPLTISQEKSGEIWKDMPYFKVEPESKDVAIEKGGTLYSVLTVENLSLEPITMTIEMKADEACFKLLSPAQMELAKKESRDIEIQLLNPDGKSHKGKVVLTPNKGLPVTVDFSIEGD